MSADVVNLRRARKSKLRSEKEKAASENRITFGRTKAEKLKAQAERSQQLRAIEGHRRDKA